MSNLKFPDNFYWGTSTAAHQVEGNNHNDWTEWEKNRAEYLASQAEAKFAHWLPTWERFKSQAQDPKNYISGPACDHYHKFKQDFDIAKQLGHNAQRFSIEWSRIEPEEGKFSQVEINHYGEVIDALIERGIEPFVCLWHYTNPVWFNEIGGWEKRENIKYFLRFVELISKNFGLQVKYWLTFNEPNALPQSGYWHGSYLPEKNDYNLATKVFANLILAHKKAYRAIHHVSEQARVGLANSLVYYTPAQPDNRKDNLAVKRMQKRWGYKFIRQARATQDFIGVNYYHHGRIRFIDEPPEYNRNENLNKWTNDMGHEIYPEGIYRVLKYLSAYKLPVIITENGVADELDQHRPKFITEHLKWVNKAIAEKVDVRGYLHWSLLDNFEWDKGYWPRFGLVAVDYKTQKRTIRPSAEMFAKIIKNNSI